MKINVSTSKIEELNYLGTWMGYENVIQIFKPNSLVQIFFFEYLLLVTIEYLNEIREGKIKDTYNGS